MSVAASDSQFPHLTFPEHSVGLNNDSSSSLLNGLAENFMATSEAAQHLNSFKISNDQRTNPYASVSPISMTSSGSPSAFFEHYNASFQLISVESCTTQEHQQPPSDFSNGGSDQLYNGVGAFGSASTFNIAETVAPTDQQVVQAFQQNEGPVPPIITMPSHDNYSSQQYPSFNGPNSGYQMSPQPFQPFPDSPQMSSFGQAFNQYNDYNFLKPPPYQNKYNKRSFDTISDSSHSFSTSSINTPTSPMASPVTKRKSAWTQQEDQILLAAYDSFPRQWAKIATLIQGRTNHQVKQRWSYVLNSDIRNGQWTSEEDSALVIGYHQHGNQWAKIALSILGRTNIQCRNRWKDVLDPQIRNGPWSEFEDEILAQGFVECGPKWAKIAVRIPGRTGLQCRDRFQRKNSSGPAKSPQSPRIADQELASF